MKLTLEAGRTGLTEKEERLVLIQYCFNRQEPNDYYPGQSDLTIKLIYTKAEHILMVARWLVKDAVLRVDVLQLRSSEDDN